MSDFTRRQGRAIAGLILLATVLVQSALNGQNAMFAPAGSGEDVLWEKVTRDYMESFVEPTEPVPLNRLIMPWEPVQAVVLALPLSDWQAQPEFRAIFVDMLKVLLPRVKVIALYHEDNYRLLGDLLQSLKGEPDIAPYLDRMEFLGSGIFSVWARDFVPVFGRGADDGLVAVTGSFIPVRRMMTVFLTAKSKYQPAEQYFSLVDGANELKGLYGSDRVASALVSNLRARFDVPVSLSRSSIYLLGGDFLPLDGNAALVSGITLDENGGDTLRMDQALREYFGIERVVYLENLPGDTIEHLDFITLPIAEKTILTARVPEFSGERPYHRYLEAELRGRLTRNRERLEKAFPGRRIVQVPMLPPVLDSRDMVIDELFLHCVGSVSSAKGYPLDVSNGPGPLLDPSSMDPQVVRGLQSALGVQRWDRPADRAQAVAYFLKRPIDELVDRHVEEHIQHRSYINCLYLKTADEGEILLLPRYRPLSEAEVDLIQSTEAEVEKIYRSLFPEASLHWIDCTRLTPLQGAIHCLTSTVPAN